MSLIARKYLPMLCILHKLFRFGSIFQLNIEGIYLIIEQCCLTEKGVELTMSQDAEYHKIILAPGTH